MAASEVKVLGSWPSPYVVRVRIALNLKGVDYEFIEENTHNKSELLLRSNPVYKKIPVLFHTNKLPICESLLIVQYVDEVWPHGHSIMPNDPYDRALARFWGAYIDNKWSPLLHQLGMAQGEEAKVAVIKRIAEDLWVLEDAFAKCSKGKPYFGGDNIGYIDIALGCFVGWLKVGEKLAKTILFDEAKIPGLVKWAERFSSHVAVKDVLLQPEMLMKIMMKTHARVAVASPN